MTEQAESDPKHHDYPEPPYGRGASLELNTGYPGIEAEFRNFTDSAWEIGHLLVHLPVGREIPLENHPCTVPARTVVNLTFQITEEQADLLYDEAEIALIFVDADPARNPHRCAVEIVV